MTRVPTPSSENLRAVTARHRAHNDRIATAHDDGSAHTMDGPVGCPECARMRKVWRTGR
jgi:hypothetical protein